MQNDDFKKVKNVLKDIEKKFGDGSVMMLNQKPFDVPSISTGALTVDTALGVGGIPYGRITVIYGPEASGKSTLCLEIIANAQKMGEQCAFIDVENALDPTYARAIGVQTENLLISQPDYGEQALDIIEALVDSGEFNVIVVDSIAALTPKAELEGEMGDQQMGLQARLMGKALRKLTSKVNKMGVCLIFTNQNRMKIGVMYGNPETQPGGNAIKYFASVLMEIRRKEDLKKSDETYGIVSRVKVKKNKVAPPHRQAEFTILYGQGIDKVGCIVDEAINKQILERKGPWYYYGEEKFQGKDSILQEAKDNEKFLNSLKNDLNNKDKKEKENHEQMKKRVAKNENINEEEKEDNNE